MDRNEIIILNEFELGKIGIRVSVLENYIKRAMLRFSHIIEVPKKRRFEQVLAVQINTIHDNVDVTVSVILKDTNNLDENIKMIQQEIKKDLIQFLGVPVGEVNIIISDVKVA